jgi:hypothetical protein
MPGDRLTIGNCPLSSGTRTVTTIIAKILLILPLVGACANVRAVESETPACSNPAKLEGHPDPQAPGIFIAFKPGVEPIGAAASLAKKYHFNTAIQYSWGTIFTRNLDPKLIPSILCERDVEYLEFNAVATIAGASAMAAPKFSMKYKISSNRTNDRSWMTGLGCLASDGVVSPERPGQTEKSRQSVKPNMRVEVASLEPHKFASFFDVDGAPIGISAV